jgi:ribosome biogenesis GTPase A
MTKAIRQMQEDIKLIDLVIELVDARIPLSSRNPEIDRVGAHKARLILLNKADLADPVANQSWNDYFTKAGYHLLAINARSGEGLAAINRIVQEACRDKIARDLKRGIKNRPVRAMVVGIPNVGKSTFINSFAGKACTKTGNKPGVTRGKQWIRLNKQLELLDTPGVLWPRFEDQAVGMRLAMIGSINDDIIDTGELALDILDFLREHYPAAVEKRYGITNATDNHGMLTEICINRHCYQRGQTPDLDRAATIVVEDLRSGKLGRITLETPERHGYFR